MAIKIRKNRRFLYEDAAAQTGSDVLLGAQGNGLQGATQQQSGTTTLPAQLNALQQPQKSPLTTFKEQYYIGVASLFQEGKLDEKTILSDTTIPQDLQKNILNARQLFVNSVLNKNYVEASKALNSFFTIITQIDQAALQNQQQAQQPALLLQPVLLLQANVTGNVQNNATQQNTGTATQNAAQQNTGNVQNNAAQPTGTTNTTQNPAQSTGTQAGTQNINENFSSILNRNLNNARIGKALYEIKKQYEKI